MQLCRLRAGNARRPHAVLCTAPDSGKVPRPAIRGGQGRAGPAAEARLADIDRRLAILADHLARDGMQDIFRKVFGQPE